MPRSSDRAVSSRLTTNGINKPRIVDRSLINGFGSAELSYSAEEVAEPSAISGILFDLIKADRV